MASIAFLDAIDLFDEPSRRGKNVNFDGCFAWFHAAPDEAAGQTAVVLCPGLKNDALRAHHALRLLADALAQNGFHTLRFDYPGTGDSLDLDSGDPWETWQQSIHAAADWLRRHTGARRIVLCGVRLGSALATLVAADRSDVAGLVLLAPVLRGRSYIRQLSIEAHVPQGVLRPGEDLVLQELCLPAATVSAIAAVDLHRVVLPPGCKVALHAEIPSPTLAECAEVWSRGGAVVTRADFAGLEPMLRPVFMNHEPPAEVGRIVTWLQASLPPDGHLLQATAAFETPELHPPGCVETPMRFGENDRLFGVLCRPAAPPGSDLAVVIGNSSGDPHYGYARVAVDLARRLANAGFASLRMDFAGVGDSPAPGNAPTHVFETDRRGDFAAAIDALSARGYRRFALEGLCSGAYHAFHAALNDERIGVLLLVNLPMFQWQEGTPVELLEQTMQSPVALLQKLRHREMWLRLLHERSELGGRLAQQAGLLARKVRAAVLGTGALLGLRGAPSFAQASLQQLSRRTRTLFLMAAGDMGIAALAQEFGPHRAPPGATLRIIPGLDHAVAIPAMQALVARELIDFLRADPVPGTLSDQVSTAAAPSEMDRVHA